MASQRRTFVAFVALSRRGRSTLYSVPVCILGQNAEFYVSPAVQGRLSSASIRSGPAVLHQRDQFVAVMFELLVADTRDIAQLRRRDGWRCRDGIDRGVVQHDIGRDAALARHFRTPRPEGTDQ